MTAPKVLIVRFTAIGDCVMALPVASRIRSSHPDAQIHWVIDRRCADVVQSPGLVDRLIVRDGQREKKLRWTPMGLKEQWQLFAGLRKQRYDYGIDLQGHSKTGICLRLANPKARIAVRGTDPLAKQLNPVAKGLDGHVHIVEQNLYALAQLGFPHGDATPKMPDLEAEKNELARHLPPKPLCTITMGAGHPKKVVPAENWKAVGTLLASEGFLVGFLGGPSDIPVDLDGSIDWVGKLSLRQSMAAVGLSAIHLSGDTGTAHIASALGIPTVTVAGHMSPDQYRPYWGKNIMLQVGGEAWKVPQSAIFASAMQAWREFGG